MCIRDSTSTCKNVDRVVEWLDYMYSAEGQMLLNMGIEGTHYTMQDLSLIHI